MKFFMFLLIAVLASSCASYKLVDTDDCEAVQGSIKKCREVK